MIILILILILIIIIYNFINLNYIKFGGLRKTNKKNKKTNKKKKKKTKKKKTKKKTSSISINNSMGVTLFDAEVVNAEVVNTEVVNAEVVNTEVVKNNLLICKKMQMMPNNNFVKKLMNINNKNDLYTFIKNFFGILWTGISIAERANGIFGYLNGILIFKYCNDNSMDIKNINNIDTIIKNTIIRDTDNIKLYIIHNYCLNDTFFNSELIEYLFAHIKIFGLHTSQIWVPIPNFIGIDDIMNYIYHYNHYGIRSDIGIKLRDILLNDKERNNYYKLITDNCTNLSEIKKFFQNNAVYTLCIKYLENRYDLMKKIINSSAAAITVNNFKFDDKFILANYIIK